MSPEVRNRSIKVMQLVEAALDLGLTQLDTEARLRVLDLARSRHETRRVSDETWMYVQAGIAGMEGHLRRRRALEIEGRRRGW